MYTDWQHSRCHHFCMPSRYTLAAFRLPIPLYAYFSFCVSL
jgi:hypothetical protein